MPSRSPAQARLMAAVAHSPGFARKVGIAQRVGRDFNRADTGGPMIQSPRGAAAHHRHVLQHVRRHVVGK